MGADSPITTQLNVPRAVNLSKGLSPVPPGVGDLNYIQMLLAGITDQGLYTSSSPTFVALTLSGLTASALVGTNTSKQLQTVNPGTSLSLSGTSLNTIQGIRTADSPTFTGLTLGSMAGILKAAAGVVGQATIGTSLSYAAPTLDAIQDIRTSSSPTHAGLTLSGLSTGGLINSIAGVLALCQLQANLTWSASDTSLVALLHLDGADTSTTFTDVTGKVWTANGNAQVDTAQSKFGGASLLLDGTGDYLSTPDHADFAFGSAFTIDCWVRFNAFPTSGNGMTIYTQRQGDNDFITYSLQNVGGNHNWEFEVKSGGVDIIKVTKACAGGNLSLNTWYHIALVKNGNDYLLFQGGVQCGTTATDTSAIPNLAAGAVIGIWATIYGAFNGWIDEFRISNVARWTAGFTPSTSAYTSGGGLNTVQDIQTTSTPAFSTLGLADTNASHYLRLLAGSDLTADRILTFTTGDAARTITLSGNPTLDDWFDQAVKAASDVTHGSLIASNLTVSVPVVTDADKKLVSQTYADFKSSLAIAQADISGLTMVSSPSFAGLTLTGLTGGYLPYIAPTTFLATNSPIFTDGTNVGIGTTAPESGLVVQKSTAGGRGGEISIVNHAAVTTGNSAALNFGLENSTYGTDDGNAQIKAVLSGLSGTSTDLAFSLWSGAAWLERMRILSNGNVGIGTTSPGAKLDVNGTEKVVGAFGCNNATPQTSYASGGAITPGAGAYGADSAVNFAAMVTLVQNMRAALVANGIMS